MKSGEDLVQAIEVTPELKPVVGIDAGSDQQFIDLQIVSSVISASGIIVGESGIIVDG